MDHRAFFWDPSSGVRVLSTLNSDSSAWAFNKHGFASGWSTDKSGYLRAARWVTSGETFIDIGAFTNTNPDPVLSIMWDDLTGKEHGFIFDIENGVRDLYDLMPGVSGWVLTYARDINNGGQIVGFGNLNGEKRGFFMDPVRPVNPSVYMLLLGE